MDKNTSLPVTLFFALLILFANDAVLQARSRAGYVVNTSGDTIYGDLKIPLANFQTGGLVINGIDLSSLYYRVVFKPNNKQKKKTYEPSDLQTFTFFDNHQKYQFRSFKIPKKQMGSAHMPDRFLCLLLDGKVDLYNNWVTISQGSGMPSNETFGGFKDYNQYTEYFVLGKDLVLRKVEYSSNSPTLQSFLSVVGLEHDFINTLPKNLNFKDIKTVLLQYESWLLSQESDLRSI